MLILHVINSSVYLSLSPSFVGWEGVGGYCSEFVSFVSFCFVFVLFLFLFLLVFGFGLVCCRCGFCYVLALCVVGL